MNLALWAAVFEDDLRLGGGKRELCPPPDPPPFGLEPHPLFKGCLCPRCAYGELAPIGEGYEFSGLLWLPPRPPWDQIFSYDRYLPRIEFIDAELDWKTGFHRHTMRSVMPPPGGWPR